ncbi:integration host factor subunit alpha [Deferribacterales bacterium RsTz2092]|nr:integration host factor subunit alpha [Deferribacterales bacterium]
MRTPQVITRVALVDALFERNGWTKKDIATLVNVLFDEIKRAILKKEAVKIPRFGTFEVKLRGRHIGRNPKTGEEKIIAPHNALKFKPSKQLKNRLNSKSDGQ